MKPQASREEQASARTFFHLRGSMTPEAALAAGLWIFAMLTVMTLFSEYRLELSLSFSVQEALREAAMENRSPSETEALLRRRVREVLREEWWNLETDHPFTAEAEAEEEILKTQVTYMTSLRLNVFRIPVREHVITGARRWWSGKERTARGDDMGEETYVYITAYGEVYHRERGCSYLNVSPVPTAFSALSTLRNADRGKYYPCEYCVKDTPPGIVYVTPQGERYHGSLSCLALRRWVRRVPLSQAAERRPCSRCAA